MRNEELSGRKISSMAPALTAALALAALLLWAALAAAAGRPSHMTQFTNPEGCAGCHAGKGEAGTPLLKAKREELCFLCHGTFSRGKAKAKDIESVLGKESRHPVLETSQYHMRGEVLPEDDSSARRHVACEDCHVAHMSTPDVPWKGSRGYVAAPGAGPRGFEPQGLRLRHAAEEYEMCYLCHSDSANLPGNSRNIAELMDSSNQSYHPVESPGRNTNMPSLVRALSITSRIACDDCHGNSDERGPKGPHGSDYAPLLLGFYKTEDGAEDPKNYELCYMCHDRRSILGDESFTKHNRHIVMSSTACYTCHNSHGSNNPNLIEFNTMVVNPSFTSGGPVYLPGSFGKPTCYLECHGADHNSTGIFVGGAQTGSWP